VRPTNPVLAEESFAKVVGRRLRAIREQRKLSPLAVQALTKGRIQARTLSGYEAGTEALAVETAAELAALYQVRLVDLFQDNGSWLTVTDRLWETLSGRRPPEAKGA
jgi:transcriptional regulator with XRE-family HTH domain